MCSHAEFSYALYASDQVSMCMLLCIHVHMAVNPHVCGQVSMWLCTHVQVAVCPPPPAEFSYISCPFILVHVAVYPHAHDLASICMCPCIHVSMYPKKVQLTLSKKPGRMGIHNHETGTAFPSKGISYLYIILTNDIITILIVCARKKKVDSLCRLKINQASGSDTCV
jgi:hypothetical protein